MLSSSSTHRIQNFKKRQICLSLYLSTKLRLHPLPLLAFSIIFAFIRRSHAKRLALMEKIQNHGRPIPCVVPPRKFRNREVRSTGASSPRQRQATVIFSFNILSRRRSSGERRTAALAEQLDKPAAAPPGRAAAGVEDGKSRAQCGRGAELFIASSPCSASIPPLRSASAETHRNSVNESSPSIPPLNLKWGASLSGDVTSD